MTEPTPTSTSTPELLARHDLEHFIDGRWQAGSSQDRIETRNPATGAVLATLARGGSADIDRAVRSARAAFEGPWSRFTPNERHRMLVNIYHLVEERFEELALLESLDVGVPLSRARNSKAAILRTILYFASQTANTAGQTLPSSLPGNIHTQILRAPVGVIGGIIPWNGPLISQWWILGGALATGCTVVMKPAEDASLTTLRMAELLIEAGLPAGVVNVVTGLGSEAGAALAEHNDVDRVAFTGSTETGRAIIRASAGNIKRIQLELGGKSPDIIFADADLDKAVPGAAMGVFANSGQICFAGTRVLVQRGIQKEFVARMVEFGRTLRVGDPLDLATDLGPLINQKQLDQVSNYVSIGQAEGADLVLGGQRLLGDVAQGYFIEATIFDNVTNEMRIAQEEIFGPVVSIVPFDTAEEALRIANDTQYGLGGAVWSRDVGTVNTMVHGIKAGTVWVNCYGLIDPTVGFGGIKHSGYGWKGGPSHVDGYLYNKSVYLDAD